MNIDIEKLLNNLNCTIYKFDKDKNLIYKNTDMATLNMIQKELIVIVCELEVLDINYEVDDFNNILIIK